MKLTFGVTDIPYAANGKIPPKVAQAKKGKANKPLEKTAGEEKAVSTGDVAEWLESEYHVMETFARMNEENIAKYLENSLAGSLENTMMGAPPAANPYAGAESAIEDRFKQFLLLNEIEGSGIPGVPTTAAMKGVNHRLKSGKGSPRPSFIDTGLYESSFVAKVE